MGALNVPILPGKSDDWKNWITELTETKLEEFEEFNTRYGLTTHKTWLNDTPNGDTVIVLHEGPGSNEFMPKLAESNHPFDTWFKSKVTEIHGLDFNKLENMKPPTLMLNFTKNT